MATKPAGSIHSQFDPTDAETFTAVEAIVEAQDAPNSGNLVTGYEFLMANNWCKTSFETATGIVGTAQKYLTLKYWKAFMLKSSAAQPMDLYWDCFGEVTSKTKDLTGETCFENSDCGPGEICSGAGACVEIDDDTAYSDPTDDTLVDEVIEDILEDVILSIWDILPAKLNPAVQALQAERAWDPTTAWWPIWNNEYGKDYKSLNMFFDVFSGGTGQAGEPNNEVSLLIADPVSGPAESVFQDHESDNFAMWATAAINSSTTSAGKIIDADQFTQARLAKFDIIRYFLGKYWTRVRNADAVASQYSTGGSPTAMPIATLDSALAEVWGPWAASHIGVMQKIAPDSIGTNTHQILEYDFTFPESPNEWSDPALWKPKNELADPDLPYYMHQLEITNMTPSTVDILGQEGEAIMSFMQHVATKQANDVPFLKLLRNRVEADNVSDPFSMKYKYDHVFEFPVPFSEEEMLTENADNPLYVKIKPIYNFYSSAYESVAGIDFLIETDLPHMYMILVDNENKQDTVHMFNTLEPAYGGAGDGAILGDIRSLHRDHITLFGAIDGALVDVNKMGEGASLSMNAEGTSIKSDKVADADAQNYFTAWADVFLNTDKYGGLLEEGGALSLLTPIRNKMLNQVFFPNTTYQEIERMKGMFPMMVDLRFSPIPPPPKEESVLDAMMNPSGETAPIWYAFLKYMIKEINGYWTETTICPTTFSHDGEPAVNSHLLEFDFYQFLKMVESPSGAGINVLRTKTEPGTADGQSSNKDCTVIVPQSIDSKLGRAMFFMEPPQSESSADRTGMWLDSYTEFKKKFDDIVMKKTRTYTDVFGGKTAKTEVLFWKIDKYRILSTGGLSPSPVTTYHIPNIPGVDEIKLLDTQVKYDTGYVYNISAITMVFGTQYNYRNPKEAVKTNNSEGSHFSLSGNQDQSYAAGVLTSTLMVPYVQWKEDGFSIPSNHALYWPSLLGNMDMAGTVGVVDSGALSEVWPRSFMNGDVLTIGAGPDVGWFTNLMLNSTANNNSFPHEFAPYKAGEQITIFEGVRGWTNPAFNIPEGLASSIRPITNYSLALDVFSRPSVKVMEVPYHIIDTRIMDRPPLPPIVSLTPYKGVNNNFLLSFDPGTGRVEEEAIALIPTDDAAIEKQKNVQNAGVPPVYEFKSDDTPAFFEIFRIDKPELEGEIKANAVAQYYPPISYSNFTNSSFFNRISATKPFNLRSTGASSVSVRETIQPNKKYYYTFRSVDIHGNISNPTPVFEVEIVDDGGTVYMMSKVYNFEIPERTNIKSMKKYINIVPTIEQVMHDGANMDPPTLGITESSIFDESSTFKIRLTSKQTGKKIDLNVNFDLKNKGYDT